MTDILSQEEIDALLSAGIGGLSDEEEERPPKPAPKAAAAKPASKPSPQPSFSQGFQFEDFSSPPPSYTAAAADTSAKKRVALKPSAKVENPVNVQTAVFTSFDEDEIT